MNIVEINNVMETYNLPKSVASYLGNVYSIWEDAESEFKHHLAQLYHLTKNADELDRAIVCLKSTLRSEEQK